MSFLGRKPADAIATTADIADGVVTAAKLAGDFDDNIQTNIALLGFKVAVNGSLAKYDLQDQIVDEYTTNAGINTGDSTYEILTGGIYRGENPTASSAAPTVTEDADVGPTVDGDYTWYKWTGVGAGSYSTSISQDHEFLVVAGGGGGGGNASGGGGAGGYRTSYGTGNVSGGLSAVQSDLSFVASTTYTITVGAGGALGGTSGWTATDGSDGAASSITGSDITNVTTVGGGGGTGRDGSGRNGNDGGSGGALSSDQTGNTTGQGTAGEGFDAGPPPTSAGNGSGGGGAAGLGTQGTTSTSVATGIGGAGFNSTITGSSVGYAGGGGGGKYDTTYGSTASHGGGAGGTTGNASHGTANTGGGGGGAGYSSSANGGTGGSGVVILRRLTLAVSPGPGDLILQSSDTTAETAPTKADMIILVEDAGSGVGIENTHIKGWVSRYETGGTKTWTQGALVDEGHWEGGPSGGKRILAFHDLTLTGTSGTQMAYKITTHSASAVFDTRIHATSIGWR